MGIADPGPGDLYDRLSVLAMKLVWSSALDLEITEQHQEEFDKLLCKLEARYPAGLGQWADRFQLAAINGVIWQATDRLREMTNAVESADATLGMMVNHRLSNALGAHILRWNDTRQRLVARLNKMGGAPAAADPPHTPTVGPKGRPCPDDNQQCEGPDSVKRCKPCQALGGWVSARRPEDKL